MLDEYAIRAPNWVGPAVAMAAALLLLLLTAYWRSVATTPVRVCAAGLKLLAIVALLVCLLEPVRSGRRPRPQANVVAVVVDNSQSMQLKAPAARMSRGERMSRVLDEESLWRARLARDFDVRTYTFDAGLQRVDDYASLQFDGVASSLGTALATIASRFRIRPVAGVLLFTDGNATDMDKLSTQWSHLGLPVYPVIEANASQLTDLRIRHVAVSQTDFEAAPVTLNVQTDSVGFGGQKIVAKLLDETGQQIEEQVLTASPDGEPTDFRFRFRPENSGLRFYQVVVIPESEQQTYERGETGAEATLANNVRDVAVHRRRGPYRVLYVAGRPNWEFKFLRRALDEDEEVQLVGLVRIAREEPKFNFRDRAVNSTNPLFSGFDAAEDENSEQYDEPVLLRLGIDEADELRDGFPKAADQLFAYDAVLLDDLEASFFTQDQMLLLRRFVSERGGGLLILGGQESFAKGDYDQSPLGEIAPVYVPQAAAAKPTGPFRIELTREGWLQPWMRMRATEAAERNRLDEMPAFATLNSSGDVKPGASLLATIQSSGENEIPGLVVQRFGKGRSAALLIGDMWRWAMQGKLDQQQDLPQMWRQMIRWLVSDVPRQVEMKVRKATDPNQPVVIEVLAYDEVFQPLDNAVVQLRVTSTSGQEYSLTAEPSDERVGAYLASYWPDEKGSHRIVAQVTAPDGSQLDEQASGWTADPAVAEFQTLEPNLALLESIARQTGGEVVPQIQLDSFVDSLPDRKIPVTEHWVYPLWHQPLVLLIAMACLCGEWGLRRWKGLR